MELAFRPDLSGLTRGMDAFHRKQLPFATSLALTATAGHVGLAWDEEMKAKLDRPTPFTLGAVAVNPARTSRLVATVGIKDIAAQYLEPFVDGGLHFLGGKRAILAPKNVPLNAYGNLTRGKIAALKAKQNVFVGAVTLKSGAVVSGVWQRPPVKGSGKGGARRKGQQKTAAPLKLLIRFSDDQPVTQHLDFKGRAERAVRAHFAAEFTMAFEKAMATAR